MDFTIGRHPVLKYRVPHGSQPRPGWAPDPLMVGIRSPDGLVVGPVCVFITAGPIIKLCAGGEGDSEGHVL